MVRVRLPAHRPCFARCHPAHSRIFEDSYQQPVQFAIGDAANVDVDEPNYSEVRASLIRLRRCRCRAGRHDSVGGKLCGARSAENAVAAAADGLPA